MTQWIGELVSGIPEGACLFCRELTTDGAVFRMEGLVGQRTLSICLPCRTQLLKLLVEPEDG